MSATSPTWTIRSSKSGRRGRRCECYFGTLYCRVQKGYGFLKCPSGNDPSSGYTGDLRHGRDDRHADRKRLCLCGGRWNGLLPCQKLQGLRQAFPQNLDDLEGGKRSLLVSGADQKEDPLDFVLWKPKKRASLSGNPRGATADRAGTLSAQS